MRLPASLVAGILHMAIAAARAESAEDDCIPKAGSSSLVSDGPDTKPSQLTLWDVGFSLRQSWLTERAECALPPDRDDSTAETAVNLEEVKDAAEHLNVDASAVIQEQPRDFPSFEEWKRSQDSDPPASASAASSNASVAVTPPSEPEIPKPQNDTRKSTHGRYNYASPDCSARIHSASRQTQHASSLLHKSKDRYMLTPCKADEHWVVVELCDEIRIESFDLAIWEFFSGVVREIRVSVGGEDGEVWKDVGTFIGQNVRGVQTFELPQATAFHRFLRLDFPSYYGSEYYCPVSQVKVFGMNQMEAFKWEQKLLNLAKPAKSPIREEEEAQTVAKAEERRREDERRERELGELERLVQAQAKRLEGGLSAFLSATSTSASVTGSISADVSDVTSMNTTTSARASVHEVTSTSDGVANSSAATNSTTRKADSSESIYAQIIRRLNALEGNSTLVGRYIEEQSKVMRLLLGRMEKGWDEWKHIWEEEERGRREQNSMRQEDRIGRVLSQLEKQRLMMDHDRRMTENHLRILREELGHERRRGIAQLLIMVVIIILGVLTRGETINAVLKPLVADVRRRRSIYSRRSLSTGISVDVRQPQVLRDDEVASLVEKSALRRPLSPSGLRLRKQYAPTPRSASEATAVPSSPRIRATLATRTPTAPPRKAARNAHLHPLRTDDFGGKRVARRSPVQDLNDFVMPRSIPAEEDWGTDHETDASTSEIDDELTRELKNIWNTTPI